MNKTIIHGDMPGDVIKINDEHINKANLLFPLLMDKIKKVDSDKIVISVFGGSGVGKSEIASLLGQKLIDNGINTYIMSGDNYPYRIPLHNDAERLMIFRNNGFKALFINDEYNKEGLDYLIKNNIDASYEMIDKYPFLETYIKGGRAGLKEYLGTKKELNYDQVNSIIKNFKGNRKVIDFKRMGRSLESLYYDSVDVSNVKVLLIEWTHGGSKYLEDVDIKILLHSSPEETKKHRLERARDGNADSPFTSLVLEIEQEELDENMNMADIIISKKGEIVKK